MNNLPVIRRTARYKHRLKKKHEVLLCIIFVLFSRAKCIITILSAFKRQISFPYKLE